MNVAVLHPPSRPAIASAICGLPGLDVASLSRLACDPSSSPECVSWCCACIGLLSTDPLHRALLFEADAAAEAAAASAAPTPAPGPGPGSAPCGILGVVAARLRRRLSLPDDDTSVNWLWSYNAALCLGLMVGLDPESVTASQRDRVRSLGVESYLARPGPPLRRRIPGVRCRR